MEMDPNPPSFPGVQYTAGTMNLGSSYAAGMEAGAKAGEPIGKGLSAIGDVMMRNRTANDTLQAMNQTGMLSDKAYQAVAGKSLGAKEQMLGMYASQWAAQQAQARELQKQGYGAGLDVWKQHQALLDEITKLKETRPQTLPMQRPPQQQPPAPQAQPAQPIRSQANLPIGRQNLTVSGIPGVAAPLGSGNIYNPPANQPQYNIGAAVKPNEQIVPGARSGVSAQGQRGYLWPDANAPGGFSFRPLGTT